MIRSSFENLFDQEKCLSTLFCGTLTCTIRQHHKYVKNERRKKLSDDIFLQLSKVLVKPEPSPT